MGPLTPFANLYGRKVKRYFSSLQWRNLRGEGGAIAGCWGEGENHFKSAAVQLLLLKKTALNYGSGGGTGNRRLGSVERIISLSLLYSRAFVFLVFLSGDCACVRTTCEYAKQRGRAGANLIYVHLQLPKRERKLSSSHLKACKRNPSHFGEKIFPCLFVNQVIFPP